MNKIKSILLVVLGMIVMYGISGAYILKANDVTYDKKNTTLESEQVQGAIDELYTLVSENSNKGGNVKFSIPTRTITYTCDGTYNTIYIFFGYRGYVTVKYNDQSLSINKVFETGVYALSYFVINDINDGDQIYIEFGGGVEGNKPAVLFINN